MAMTDKQAAARDWLNRNKGKHDEIRAYRLKLEDIRSHASVLVNPPKENKVQTQPDPKRGEKAIISAITFEDQIKQKETQLHLSEVETEKVIAKLPNSKERTVLIYRYLCFKSWEYIARQLHFSIGHCHKIHLEALDHIADLIDYTVT